jgi:hypothetical protein
VKWQETLHQAVLENETGLGSSTRIAVILATFTLSLSTIVLTFAVIQSPELVPALSVVAGALGGMAGVSYTAGRAWSGTRLTTKVDNPDA